MLDCEIGRHGTQCSQNKTAPLLQIIQAPVFRKVMEQPMTRIDMQDLDAVFIEKLSDSMEIGAVPNKNRVVPRWDKAVVLFADNVDSIAQVQKRPGHLPGLPSTRVVAGYWLASFQEKGYIAVAK